MMLTNPTNYRFLMQILMVTTLMSWLIFMRSAKGWMTSTWVGKWNHRHQQGGNQHSASMVPSFKNLNIDGKITNWEYAALPPLVQCSCPHSVSNDEPSLINTLTLLMMMIAATHMVLWSTPLSITTMMMMHLSLTLILPHMILALTYPHLSSKWLFEPYTPTATSNQWLGQPMAGPANS